MCLPDSHSLKARYELGSANTSVVVGKILKFSQFGLARLKKKKIFPNLKSGF